MRFDDIALDQPVTVGSHLFGEAEILAFARDFDPQPFHLDHDAAQASHFGGLIASGWHVCAIWMRLTIEHAAAFGDIAGISPGMEHIRWLKPVRPGDRITFANSVHSKRRLNSRPGWAVITQDCRGDNQSGQQAFAMRGTVLVPIEA